MSFPGFHENKYGVYIFTVGGTLTCTNVRWLSPQWAAGLAMLLCRRHEKNPNGSTLKVTFAK